MDERMVTRVMEEEARVGMPDAVDVWPALRTRLEKRAGAERPRRRLRVRLGRGVAGLLALLALGAGLLAATPGVREGAWEVVRRLGGGIRSGPGPTDPIEFRPSPPFTVYQPTYIPRGFQRDYVEWAASAPRLEIRWGSPEGSEIRLLERPVQPEDRLPAGEPVAVLGGEEGRLIRQREELRLVWPVHGTWHVLEANVPEEALLEVARSMRPTSMPPRDAEPRPGNLPTVQERRIDPATVPNISLYSARPQLAQLEGQEYLGRVLWEFSRREGWGQYGPTSLHSPQPLRERALEVLRDPSRAIEVASPWTLETRKELGPGDAFVGRVVIEVWERDTVLAVRGTAPRDELIARALVALEHEFEAARRARMERLGPLPRVLADLQRQIGELVTALR